MLARGAALIPSLKIISFNIRYAAASDGENSWSFRRELVSDLLDRERPDIFGLQEAQQVQMDELGNDLPDYDFIGVGREDGELRGEYCAIFFRRERFSCLHQGTFWLSETPALAGSRGWDAHNARICTWGTFQESGSANIFCVFNTHLDHRGELAKLEGARLIAGKIQEIAGIRPTILMGDFNTQPGSAAYELICHTASENRLVDARSVSQTPPLGPAWTVHHFSPPGVKRIDFIFVGESLKVESYAHLEEPQPGRFASDHLAVRAEIQLPVSATISQTRL